MHPNLNPIIIDVLVPVLSYTVYSIILFAPLLPSTSDVQKTTARMHHTPDGVKAVG